MTRRTQDPSPDVSRTTVSVEFTEVEARGLRLATVFGVPMPVPPEIVSARAKLGAAEAKMKEARDAPQ